MFNFTEKLNDYVSDYISDIVRQAWGEELNNIPAEEPSSTGNWEVQWEAPHPSIVSALSAVIAGENYRVFGFGETHGDVTMPDVPTGYAYFVSDIVPYLVREQGVELIGVEMLPSDAEIETYLETGEITKESTPVLYVLRFVSSEDWAEQLTLLETVRQLRAEGHNVELVGLHCDMKTRIESDMAYLDSDTSVSDLVAGVPVITENSRKFLKRALKEQRRVVLYNGAAHNNFEPSEGDLWELKFLGLKPEQAYYLNGVDVPREQVFVVDFMIPEFYKPQEHRLDDYQLYLATPSSGVRIAGEGNDRTFLFARGLTHEILERGLYEYSKPKFEGSFAKKYREGYLLIVNAQDKKPDEDTLEVFRSYE